jgi:hypothetical protein
MRVYRSSRPEGALQNLRASGPDVAQAQPSTTRARGLLGPGRETFVTATQTAAHWRDFIEVHNEANLLPPLPPDELHELAENIKQL